MRNLLTAPLPENEIAAILAATAGRPSLPLLGDPAWSAVRDNSAVTSWLAPLIARVDAEAAEPLPALTDELYADFSTTGDRLPFERASQRGRANGGASQRGRGVFCCFLN